MRQADQVAGPMHPPFFMIQQRVAVCFLICIILSISTTGTFAQQQQQPGGQQPLRAVGDQQVGLLGPQLGLGGGGGAQADFDSLIDLIQSTVAPDSWSDNGTGEGSIAPMTISGVFVDAAGTLSFAQANASPAALPQLGRAPAPRTAADVRQSSSLRFVSLPRLEACIVDRQRRHLPLDPEMLTLAGLQRIEYVMVDPDSGDLVLAGPASDWQPRADGTIVSVETGQAIVRLDDLLTLWRRPAGSFGCSINPRQEALARTQQVVRNSRSQPLEPGQRKQWLAELRDSLGKQDVEFFDLQPDSHVARVLLVADYHMKLIGMGLAEGVPGVQSYLKSVQLAADGSLPPMTVLRWWFAMHYQPVECSPQRTVFRLTGPGVQVLSENELLAARGQRVHTGQSEELNLRFARSFSESIDQLCLAYPIYGELRNVFDLSLVLALIESEGLLERVGWQPSCFADSAALRLPKLSIPREVDTVINHRVIGRKHIIAGVSGGVWIDPGSALRSRVSAEGKLAELKPPTNASANDEPSQPWWWD